MLPEETNAAPADAPADTPAAEAPVCNLWLVAHPISQWVEDVKALARQHGLIVVDVAAAGIDEIARQAPTAPDLTPRISGAVIEPVAQSAAAAVMTAADVQAGLQVLEQQCTPLPAGEVQRLYEMWVRARAKHPAPGLDPLGMNAEFLKALAEFEREVLAALAALHVVITRNEAGQIVAVTRQDEDGRIVEVLGESTPDASAADQAQPAAEAAAEPAPAAAAAGRKSKGAAKAS